MTHDPTRDCAHGRLKGKCDVCDLQAEVVRLIDENQRLRAELKFNTPPAAQPAPVQEPVCHACESIEWEGQPCPICQAPAAQKPWVGLTDEQIETIRQQPQHHKGEFDYKFDERSFARAIEAKLKEKNT